ncbi:diaminopimelate decarboxylase [Desulforhopalus sp. IMCC35007]|uniref:diaminopimelate decarboxylase n=1 Tax=Desulforhopalus sp. IMCC35007 TaxID=2569543 RepID=UPI0010AE9529|nr:diaminopimelate decarboxylase [Desulforhopalus sp. IMCC35007]TKB09437.1 diaminopimelate decarboxylase [Desulforhopalus sp. IMCC35007]
MPISQSYKNRLFPALRQIAHHYQTPFHIYDEAGIRETGNKLKEAFKDLASFKEFYAVKALPNPKILSIMKDMGFGFDCSSVAELRMSREIGATPEDLMFTSNNTSQTDFDEAALAGGCILNLDDISLIDKVPVLPELICFRYNPGAKRTGNDIIGKPTEAKYGVSHEQIVEAYRRAQQKGATRFGIHTMLASNELNYEYMVQTAEMLLSLITEISQKLNIRFEFINIGGGLGIPYKPDVPELDLKAMGEAITALFKDFSKANGYEPALYMESGRFITGPHGVLVTTAINRKNIYRTYIGVDASMSALMRPGMYDAYHHIEVVGKEGGETEIVDVVGSLCENNDKFAVQRELPVIEDGDILVIQDTGAHGIAMGFNYNGNLRPKELLLKPEATVELIRREETVDDLFATLHFEHNALVL